MQSERPPGRLLIAILAVASVVSLAAALVDTFRQFVAIWR